MGVSERLWDDVAYFFDPDLMASLPKVRVPDTSMEDWQAALDLVGESGWKCQYSEGGAVLPAPRAKGALSRPADAECPELRVWPAAEVLAIFRFHAAEKIDFDVDLRELQGQERLDRDRLPAATTPGTTPGRPPVPPVRHPVGTP
ncbi:hypothetical protein ACFYWY_37130 [Streptomyces sp. NPDC002870]|uniref:hypothetical protein n=1 Tax=Streptomyces sp. NPDC002870 TaxID=3364666 RepID=UPI0036CF83A7